MTGIGIGSVRGYLELAGGSQFTSGLASAQRSLTLTAESAVRTGAAIEGTEAAMKGSAAAATSASAGAAKFKASQLQLVAAQERLTALLGEENVAVGKLATAEAAVIRANQRVIASSPAASMRETTAATRESAVAAGSTSSKLTGLAATAGKLGLAFGAFEAVKKAIDIGKDASSFQRQMLLIQTQAGASADQVKYLTGEVLKMAGPLGTAPDELATSLYHAVSVGQGILTLAQDLDIVTVATKGAKIGSADLEETTNALTATVASGIKGAKDYGQAMGALNTIVGAGDMKLSDLNEALGSGILANMKGFGLDLNDVGAALDVFGDNNIRGANAATLLRMSVVNMAAPAATGKKTLDALGLSSTQLAEDMNKGGLNSALSDLTAHLVAAGKTSSITDLSTEIAGMKGNIDLAKVSSSSLGELLTTAFGKKAGPGLAVLVGQFDRFQAKETAIKAGADNFQSAWAATQKTVSFAFNRIESSFESAGISLANKLLPEVQGAADWVGTKLPADISKLQHGLEPLEHVVGDGLGTAFHLLGDGLHYAGEAFAAVASVVSEIGPEIRVVGGVVLAMWAAWKGYTIAVAAGRALATTLGALGVYAKEGLADMATYGAGVRATFAGNATAAERSALVQKAALLELSAATSAELAAADRASMLQAMAYADVTAASSAATVAQVANAETTAAAWAAQAATSAEAAAATAAAADVAAAEVEAAGETAAIGWGAMLGPIGLVAVGATALFGLFRHGTSDTQAITQATQGFTTALDADSDALGKHVRAQIEDNLAKDGAYRIAAKMGISQKTLTDAAMGNVVALKQVNDAIADMAKNGIFSAGAAAILSKDLKIQTSAVKDAVTQAKDKAAADGKSTEEIGKNAVAVAGQTAAMKAAKDAHDAAEKAAADNTAQIKAQTLAYQAENDALSLVNQALNSMAGQNLNMAQAQTAFDQSLLSLNESLKTNGKTVSENTDKGLANRQAVEGAASAARSLLQANAQGTGYTEKSTAAYQANAAQVLKHIAAMDGDKTAVEKANDKVYTYAQSLLKIPAVVKTEAELKADAATAALKAYKIALANIPHYWATEMDLNISENINKVASGSAGHHASGGYISGPGTGTSDSIPAMVSNGEFVVNAASTARNLPLLHAINSGVKGYASGGQVGGTESQSDFLHSLNTSAADLKAATAALAAKLGTAPTASTLYERLANAEQAFNSVRSSTAQGVYNSFNVATAGTGASGSAAPTFASISAQEKQQVLIAGQFSKGLQQLIKEGLSHDAVSEIAAQGPSALPQVKALLSATPSQIASLNASQRALDAYGASVGSSVAGYLAGPQLKAAQNNVDSEKALLDALDRVASRPIILQVDGKTIARAVNNGNLKLARLS